MTDWRKAIAVAARGMALLGSVARAEEVTLYERYGQPVAYIDTDDEMTIYTWDGKAVAYLVDAGDGSWYVYGFNGKHLGWYEGGVIWNTGGYSQCALREALTVAAYAEPAKWSKWAKWAKWPRWAPSAKPAYSTSFDRVPCGVFLRTGDPRG